MRRRTLLATSMAIAARAAFPGGVMALAGCAGTAREHGIAGFDGTTMGTSYCVRLGAGSADPSALETATGAILGRIDAAMSTFRSASEISRFNAAREPGWYPLSRDTCAVIESALRASVASGGAFDPTVGPLVDRWGFGAKAAATFPDSRSVGRMLEHVGYHRIAVRAHESRAVRKTGPDTHLDLNGIAKGFAVDEIARLLDAHDVPGYLVEVGGEIRTRGTKPDGTAWRVGLERPTSGPRDLLRVIDLAGRAIATSGDYRSFYERDGRRYSHTIDPRTGWPVSHTLASVSVVARDTMSADATSTALMVLGPEEGLDYALRHGIAAHFVVRTRGRLEARETPGFEAHRLA